MSRAGESGHTIVEALVALALLLTVLAPATAGVVHVAAGGRAARASEALERAAAALEAALAAPEPGVREAEEAGWRVRVSAERHGALLILEATAERVGRGPAVTLTTARHVP